MNWQEELAQAFRTSPALANFLDVQLPSTSYPLLVPQWWAQKIKMAGPGSPLWRQFVPTAEEDSLEGLYDPIGDQVHAKPGGLVHRYSNRVLFFPTHTCPVICRYCFRKNELSQDDPIFKLNFEQTLAYLRHHPEINEVIFSGGDPFILTDSKLKFYLQAFAQLKTIRFIRFHTRTPIILPSRLTLELSHLLENCSSVFQKILIVLHINHQQEWSPELEQKLKLMPSTVTWLSQTVLLKGVNDHASELVNLFTHLNQHSIRPYYLHHPDHVQGAMHFTLPLERGQQIMRDVRREVPGWMLPQYVIDDPKGKTQVLR